MVLISFELRKKILSIIPASFLIQQPNNGYELVTNYSEIGLLLEQKNGQFLKLFYFNRENINEVLYEANEIISIDINQTKKLSDLFYLDLLIKENENVVNYIFPKETFISLSDELLSIKRSPKKIILAKIIYDLIESFEGFGNYDEKFNESKLINLRNLCLKEIKDEIENDKIIWNDVDIDNILIMSIDELYAKIIIKVYHTDFFSYENALNILDDLELEAININENIYKKLIKFLNNDQNNKIIETIEDFVNEQKINYYYMLLKYIFKTPLYIYQSTFLLKARQILISIIHNNLYTFISLISELTTDNKEKLDFIIKVLSDSDYYYDIYTKMKNNRIINNIINDKRLKNSFPLIQILLDLKVDEITFNENEINNMLKKWEFFKSIIKEKKFRKLRFKERKKLFSFLKDKNNKTVLLNIFTKEQYDSFQRLDINQSEESLDENPINNNNCSVQVDNSNKIQENLEEENIDELNEQNVKREEVTSMIIQSYTIKDDKELENEPPTEAINFKYNNIDLNKFRKSNKYKVTEYNKTLEINETFSNSYFNYTKNLSKGHYLIAGNTRRVLLYNSFFERKLEIHLYSRPQNIYEIEDKNDDKGIIRLFACCRDVLVIILINLENYSYQEIIKSQENYISYNSYYDLTNDYFINGIKGGFLFKENRINYKINKIFEVNYINGINIKEKIFAFSSNDLVPNGENKLIIYDFNTNETLKEIKNYSFKISNSSLHVINLEKINPINLDRQILLCSCSPDLKNEKNGFLFVDINSEKKEFVECFYDTKEFEPHCFCHISIVENNNSIDDVISKEENIDIQETEFFLVGGFDPMKRIGCVKLYKIAYNERNDKINIKYLLDIETEEVDNYMGFDTDVTCISQSKITGNLLITCLDGNVYLFKPINLQLFLKN